MPKGGARQETTEQFIARGRKIHGDKYNYDKTVYNGCNNIVTITCPIHGDFTQRARQHKRSGCKRCAFEERTRRNQIVTEDYIKKARAVHGDKYNYDKTHYTGSGNKVTITCPTHGDFTQRAAGHLQGRGCWGCGRANLLTANTDSQDDFIKKARKCHGDKYNYDKVIYSTSREKVTIICPVHGEFEQSPNSHVRGYGCQVCANRNRPARFNDEYREKWEKLSGCFYLLELTNDEEDFIKVGISTNLKNRIRDFRKAKYSSNVLYSIYGLLGEMYDIEQSVLKVCWKDRYIPNNSFGGETECINKDMAPTIIKALTQL